MSPAIGFPAPTTDGTASLFRSGGFAYDPIPAPLWGDVLIHAPRWLRKALQNALPRVYMVLQRFQKAEALDERVFDRVIAELAQISMRLTQYCLYWLERAGLIRRRHAHGRRWIEILAGIATSKTKPATFEPPSGLPNSIKNEEQTTTRAESSFSSSTGEKAGEAREVAPPELVARACGLIPEATPGKVADAVAVYSADWVAQALDRVERRNSKPGNKRVESWGFILRILEEWKRLDGPPPRKPTAPAAPARPKAEPAKAEPTPRLTAEEVADLVAQCRDRHPVRARLARVQLRQALAEGLIPAELVATIPAELMESTKPRAP